MIKSEVQQLKKGDKITPIEYGKQNGAKTSNYVQTKNIEEMEVVDTRFASTGNTSIVVSVVLTKVKKGFSYVGFKDNRGYMQALRHGETTRVNAINFRRVYTTDEYPIF